MSLAQRLRSIERTLGVADGVSAWIDCANDGPDVVRVQGRRNACVLHLVDEHRGAIEPGLFCTWKADGSTTFAGGNLSPAEVSARVAEVRAAVLDLLTDRQRRIVERAAHVIVCG